MMLLVFLIPDLCLAQLQTQSKIASNKTSILPSASLATLHFGNDAPWYQQNIPFFSCSDPQIEQIYYYRWKLYKSHLKDIGDRGYIVTEFLDDVSWSLKPEESLNDATGFHIHEGRWLKDRHYVNEYINFMYQGGNDRHFSEAIAAATYDHYLVHADRPIVVQNLDAMKRLYQQWTDHYDRTKGLYYIEPLLDATEYTISSMDASGGKDGFRGGDAFRPSINSFMFANATAISKLAEMVGDKKTSQEYRKKASDLQEQVQKNLWNTNFQHFMDRYKISNERVQYGEFIRGRELAGYTPWYFELPGQDTKYVASWQHILAPDRLGGPYGVRTVEPSYEYYLQQRRYVTEKTKNAKATEGEETQKKPECQWNGPSWPFQTTLALGGMANLLNDYPKQAIVRPDDYVRLLRQYTAQHYVKNQNGQRAQPDLQEDYDPDTGKVIVGLQRSHHYNHSGYIDLIITGLVGLRPRADNFLEVNPLLPTQNSFSPPLSYFCLENVLYHGYFITILYDKNGTHYHKGTGLSIYVNGTLLVKPSPVGKKIVPLPALSKNTASLAAMAPALANLAVNPRRTGFPTPSASSETNLGINSAELSPNLSNLYQAIDGRIWFYPNVRNYWTNAGSKNKTDWYSLDFGQRETIDCVSLYFFADETHFKAPTSATIQYWTGLEWANVLNLNVLNLKSTPLRPLENGETHLCFAPVQTTRLRAVFTNPQNAALALVEMKVFGAKKVAPRSRNEEQHLTGLPVDLPNLQSENSHTGDLGGVRWRDADQGGFFSFSLNIPFTHSTPLTSLTLLTSYSLVVTYWGSDVGNRRFDILLEDTKIAEQTLENNHSGEFFEVKYPLPPYLTQGKTKIKVRFQAKPGAIAGGVFGVRIARN